MVMRPERRPSGSIAKSEFGPIRNVKDSSGWIADPRPEGALIDPAFTQLASHCRKAHSAHNQEKTEELKRVYLLAEKQRSEQRYKRKGKRHEGIQERQVTVAKRQHPKRRRDYRRDEHANYPRIKKHR